MGEETVKTDTLEIGAETDTKKKGLPKDHKNKSVKETTKKQRKSQSEDDQSEVAADSIRSDHSEDSQENDDDNNENVSSNAINDKDKDQPKTNGESQDKEFAVKSTDQEFKLRLVPLERLLCSAKKAALEREKKGSGSQDKYKNKSETEEPSVKRKLLPQRSNRKNYSVIEISSSSSSSDEEEVVVVSSRRKEDRSTTRVEKKEEKSSSKNSKSTTVEKKEEKSSSKNSKSTTVEKKEEKASKNADTLKNVESKSVSEKQSKNSAPINNEKLKTLSKSTAEIAKKKSSSSGLPPPPLTKRCVVRIKRIPWPAQNTAHTTKQEEEKGTKKATKPAAAKETVTVGSSRRKRFLSTSSSSTARSNSSKMEMPSGTKKRKKIESDSDSDFDMAEAQTKTKHDSDEDDQEGGGGGNQTESDKNSIKSSDSEIIPTRKRRVFNKKNSASDDSDFEPKGKRSPPKTKKNRRRIKHGSDDDDDDDDSDDSDKQKKKNKRKDIRHIMKTDELNVSTKEAGKEEEERRKRIEERQKLYNQIYERPETEEIKELVLDFDEESKETLLQVDAGLLKKLKPHQVAGVKFMWDACFETLTDAVEKPGSGCILAHCMGLGKTLQVVTLSHTLLANSRKTNVERVLIISPLSTLNNWAREFKQWMSFARKKNIEIYDMSRYKDKLTRIFKLKEWFDEGGVCIIGYDLYRILANEKAKGLRKKQRDELQQALINPGPDLVVCDEGHLLKNEKTSISKAVTRMRTKRRIVLTGTPLQNNLKEYYCMIQFIKPNLLGTYKEYLNRFVNPITNGQYTDSTERDIRLMRHRSHILHKLLEGCIQRRDYSVLAPYLPPKHEYVVYTTLSDLQQQLYEYYMITHRDVNTTDICGKGARLFQDFQDLRRIWTHPMNLRVNSDSVIKKRLLADDENSLDDFICDDEDDDGEGGGAGNGSSSDDSSGGGSSKSFASGGGGGGDAIASGSSKQRKTRNSKRQNGVGDNDDDDDDDDHSQQQKVDGKSQDDPSEWWKRFADEAALNNLNHSPKLLILMRLLEQCEKIGDKLLVFSQSLQSLDVIEHFLALIDRKTSGKDIDGDVGDIKGRWKIGVDYFRLDGSSSVEWRENMCKQFNNVDNLRARLFLISTRAGGLGINLVAANRVVIFDVSWNPSHDTQSIFRVYRFGQTKPCYIYRLIAMGTMEQKVYERQVTKQATAKRVIDEQQISRHYNSSDLQELYTYELKPQVAREIPILPKDRLFAELLSEYDKLIFKYHDHDSLLENEDSETLNEDDRKAAWLEYEAEKTRATQTAQYISYDRGAYANPTGSVTSSRIFGFRSDVLLQLLSMKVAKDNPEFNQNQITQLVPAYLDRLYNEMQNNDPSMYRELLDLNAALVQPGGMYMNPLLYVNQNPQAAGYYQAPHIQQQQQGMMLPAPVLSTAAPISGFNQDEVYEID